MHIKNKRHQKNSSRTRHLLDLVVFFGPGKFETCKKVGSTQAIYPTYITTGPAGADRMPLVEVTSGDGRVLGAKTADGFSYLMLGFSMIFDDV